MSKSKKPLPRSKVNPADTWDLSSLFPNDDVWEDAFSRWEKQIEDYPQFKGTLGDRAESLAACLRFDEEMDLLGEPLGTYAFLKTTEDTADSRYQRMQGRYIHAASRAGQLASYIRPEILAIPDETIRRFLESDALTPYRLLLELLLRYKPHTLGDKEEKILAMQTEMAQASGQIFRQLTDADFKFGTIKDADGETIELTHASFSTLLHSSNRTVRRKAFQQYYAQFTGHENTLAAALAGSMQRDIYYSKVRNFNSALEASLFPDQVPVSVYDNLIEAVHTHLPTVYKYYEVRRRKMKLKDIHHYDTYVPILADLQKRHTWDKAVSTVIEALQPLGPEYCGVLENGLKGRWCDRYENIGKQSGAFSCGTFAAEPYILMNYQPDVLDHVFTLAHEAGHSMHSHFSAKNQPFRYYDYVIFVAEVASTFNEQLLSKYLLSKAKNDQEKAFLINRQIDAIRGTLIRQTMFAEFEKLAHASAEAGEPLTLERFKEIYRGLLDLYFGPNFVLDDELSLECLRIPHFYRAFYVYKYATGISAAIALSDRVLNGGPTELEAYLNFLKGGCSQDPLDLLRAAGVDMEKPDAVETTLKDFATLVDELDALT